MFLLVPGQWVRYRYRARDGGDFGRRYEGYFLTIGDNRHHVLARQLCWGCPRWLSANIGSRRQ